MRMSPRKKDVYLSPGYGGQQTEQAQTCPRSGFAHSPTSDFLPKNSEYKYKGSPVSMVSISIRPKLGFGNSEIETNAQFQYWSRSFFCFKNYLKIFFVI